MLTYRETPLKRVDRFKYFGFRVHGILWDGHNIRNSVGQSKAGVECAIGQVDQFGVEG